ncbi:EF-hand domain-containing protein [Streptomyces sp. uw30]|nr:EF-hand domain-containing protein [Streptomyces sp. uw30]
MWRTARARSTRPPWRSRRRCSPASRAPSGMRRAHAGQVRRGQGVHEATATVTRLAVRARERHRHHSAWQESHPDDRLEDEMTALDPALKAVTDQMRIIGDADGDGRIDIEEFLAALRGIGIDLAHARRAFEEADKDRDGALGYEEAVSAARRAFE